MISMTPDTPQKRTLLDELDERQNEVLARLDELNLRIESVLQECIPHQTPGDLSVAESS